MADGETGVQETVLVLELPERRSLSAFTKTALTVGVSLSLALIFATAWALERRYAEREPRRATEATLARAAKLLHGLGRRLLNDCAPWEPLLIVIDRRPSDPNGGAVIRCMSCPPGPIEEQLRWIDLGAPDANVPESVQRELVRDGWGRPLVLRCPGPVHRLGWDLYSVGADGIDDEGLGDDVLVGEEVPGVP